MSEMITIEGSLRDTTGKGANHRLRTSGKLPANLMNKGKSTSISIDPKLLSKAYKAGKKFNLNLDGKSQPVRIHELHVDPLSRDPLHVDLIPDV